MRLNRLVAVFLFIFILQIPAFSQSVTTPEKGSKERKAILDALRVPVEKELGQEVLFVIEHLRVYGSWAFVGGEPQSDVGGWPDYTNTRYQADIDDEFFDNNIFAILRKRSGKWQVVSYRIGCTDICYDGWNEEYGAPVKIFPYPEQLDNY